MSKSGTILIEDARRALQLVGELRELPPSLSVRANHLINGMCQLLGAQNGLLCVMSDFRKGGDPEILHSVTGGDFSSVALRGFAEYVDSEIIKDPLVEATVHDCERPVVFARRQQVSDRDWYGSAHVSEFRKELTLVDDSIYSYFPLSKPGLIVGLGMNRAWEDRPFGKRELNLVNLMHDQLAWLYRQFENEDGVGLPVNNRPLSPRLQQTLARLIEGDSEKEVAGKLGLSVYTVHDYVKALYRRFGVNSRAQLIAKCLSDRNGNS